MIGTWLKSFFQSKCQNLIFISQGALSHVPHLLSIILYLPVFYLYMAPYVLTIFNMLFSVGKS